jgi:DNA-binding MarR family transcriptional regulator
MQQLNDAKAPTAEAMACAAAVVEAAPLLMTTIRTVLAACLPEDLTLPQLRVLLWVCRYPRVSLSVVAEHLGLSVSSISRIIDALVKRGDVQHRVSPENRRQAELMLTPQGEQALSAARTQVEIHIAAKLGSLSAEETAGVLAAMTRLQQACGGQTRCCLARAGGDDEGKGL